MIIRIEKRPKIRLRAYVWGLMLALPFWALIFNIMKG